MRGMADRRAILIAVDAVAAFAAVLIAVQLRFGSGAFSVWVRDLGLPPVWLMAVAFSILTFGSFAVAGVYRREMYWDLRTELLDLLKGLVLLGTVALSLLFLFKLEDVSRIAIIATFAILGTASVMARLAIRSATRRAAASGTALRHWVIVGHGEGVSQLTDLVMRHPHVGARIVGIVGETPPEPDLGVEWLGTVHDLPEVLRDNVVDEVIVVSDGSDPQKLQAILSVCAEQGKTVRLPLDSVAPSLLRGRMEEYDGIPMWSVLATPEHRLELAVKRIIDVAGSAALLTLLSPLLAATAIGIMMSDGRPVLYRQARGGHHGRPFQMLKFRTMVNGAEAMRDDLIDQNERTGPVFKIAADPRITRLGMWLRKTSIDETPQLLNVFFGQMSLVGPRPQPLKEVAEYDLWHRRRLSMRPGITGLWQVKARNDPSFGMWMDLDLEYIDRWSLWLDVSIIARTPVALIRSPGT